VMRAALAIGVDIVNDISALRAPGALELVAAHPSCGVCLMHMQGEPRSMQSQPSYVDVVREVGEFLNQRATLLRQHGVAAERIVIDPGIGFGKTAEQNLGLIANLEQLSREFSDFPIVIGTSRKSFIGKLLDHAHPDQRLYGTIASTVAAAMNGADIVRVHDVKAVVEALRIADAIARAG